MVTWEQKREVEELLYREAHLLDELRFDEWLDLLTDDIEYLIPLRENVQGDVEPAGHPVVKDDKLMLSMRVRKNDTGLADAVYAAVPASLVGREQVIEVGPMSGKSNVVYWLEKRGIASAVFRFRPGPVRRRRRSG